MRFLKKEEMPHSNAQRKKTEHQKLVEKFNKNKKQFQPKTVLRKSNKSSKKS